MSNWILEERKLSIEDLPRCKTMDHRFRHRQKGENYDVNTILARYKAKLLELLTSSQSTGTAPAPRPRRHRLPEKAAASSPKDAGKPLLPAANRACRHRILPARADVRTAEGGVEQVPVVQLRKEADAPPPIHRVPVLGPLDQEVVKEG